MKEFLAAPVNFFSLPAGSQIALASRSHLPRNDVLIAPASFFRQPLRYKWDPVQMQKQKKRAAKKVSCLIMKIPRLNAETLLPLGETLGHPA